MKKIISHIVIRMLIALFSLFPAIEAAHSFEHHQCTHNEDINSDLEYSTTDVSKSSLLECHFCDFFKQKISFYSINTPFSLIINQLVVKYISRDYNCPDRYFTVSDGLSPPLFS